MREASLTVVGLATTRINTAWNAYGLVMGRNRFHGGCLRSPFAKSAKDVSPGTPGLPTPVARGTLESSSIQLSKNVAYWLPEQPPCSSRISVIFQNNFNNINIDCPGEFT